MSALIDLAIYELEAIAVSEPGCWLDGDWPSGADRDGCPSLHLFCPLHADRAVRLLRYLRRDAEWSPTISATECWAGDDNVQWCTICGVALDTGGLSDHGVAELFEEAQRGTSLEPVEVVAMATAMSGADPRWRQWLEVAHATLEAHRQHLLERLADEVRDLSARTQQ